MTRDLVLDCDPGHDDAIALMLALGHPATNLLGVITVSGNHTLPKVTRNALSVLQLSGASDIAVHPGCERPLVRARELADKIHGASGLDGVELPEPASAPSHEHAVDYIVRTVMDRPADSVTLVPTGPLTSIALAVRREPRIATRVREVVLMGGGYHTGNWSAVAEFNIKTAPEAAHIVFNETWPLTMVGLDLTHQALATRQVQCRIDDVGTACSDFAVGLLEFFRTTYLDEQDSTTRPCTTPARSPTSSTRRSSRPAPFRWTWNGKAN